METTAVKLYSTGYREAKTYLAAALFVAGNIVLPQICHLVPQGGLRWLPDLFLHAGRRLQIRLAGGPADRRAFAGGELGAVRHARSGDAARDPAQIGAAGRRRKPRCMAGRACDTAPAGGRRPLLPAVRLAGRMGLDGLGGRRPCRTSASGSPVCWHRYLQDTRCSGTYYVINNPKT